MEASSLLVSLRKGMQSSSEQPFVGSDALCDTRAVASRETSNSQIWSEVFLV